jgi:3-oxoacyl-[acyl-carrier protein] reductase
MELQGKTVLITGGSRGIGKAIALALSGEKMNVAINYLSHQKEAEQVCEQIREKGGRAQFIQADVSKEKEVKHMVDTIKDIYGNVDVLINNAGIVHKEGLDSLTENDWDRVMAINLKSAFLVTQHCLPGMRKNQWGRIIHIASVAAQTGGVTSPLYVASKAGLIGLSHSYASLLAKEGITSNAISPALIETDMLLKDLKLDSPAKIPIGRFGKPEEVAEVAVMLAKNAYITGQTINVNGGWYFS